MRLLIHTVGRRLAGEPLLLAPLVPCRARHIVVHLPWYDGANHAEAQFGSRIER